MALNLEKELTFVSTPRLGKESQSDLTPALAYGSYHNEKTNIAIHIVCVPLILSTAVTLACNSPVLISSSFLPESPVLPLNLGTIVSLIYTTLFLLLEPLAGFLAAPILLAFGVIGNHVIAHPPAALGLSGVNIVCGVAHAVAWIAQFIGHGLFEGRAPALLDSLLQSLLLAPLFVWLEVLFAFGYRPDLKARVNRKVQANIKAYRSKSGQASKKVQ